MEEGFLKAQKELENHENQQSKQEGGINKLIEAFRAQSIFVLAYGTGCGAIEMPPTFTSRYDAERFGIRGAATPRQADVLVVSGYLSLKTLRRVIRTYEQMLEPKYLMAFGSCAINGGMYWDSYNTIKRLDQYLPVDMYVNGCMPRPEALIEGFVKLQERIKNGYNEAGYIKYNENNQFYKTNQKKLFGDDIEPSFTEDFINQEQSSCMGMGE